MSENKKGGAMEHNVSGTENGPSEELWLRMRAALEANDVDAMEEIEKELEK